MANAQQFWNEWEIQCLVLASFSLQVFLHFFSSIRKGNTSRLLSSLLWLAYLLADYVATFTLGRLTLHVDDPRHQLVLFWTPLLLLHLGSQETISAFSIEDAMLWKRHLLGLVSQVALAIYIVAKSWRPDKQLLGPLVLMIHFWNNQVCGENMGTYDCQQLNVTRERFHGRSCAGGTRRCYLRR